MPDDIMTTVFKELLDHFVPQQRSQAERLLRQRFGSHSCLYQFAHDLETGAIKHREIDRMLAASPARYEYDYDAYMELYDARFGQEGQSGYQWLIEILSHQDRRTLRGFITALKLVAFLH